MLNHPERYRKSSVEPEPTGLIHPSCGGRIMSRTCEVRIRPEILIGGRNPTRTEVTYFCETCGASLDPLWVNKMLLKQV